MAPSTWHHLAVSWDAASAEGVIYVDGVASWKGEVASRGSSRRSNGCLVLGQVWCAYQQFCFFLIYPRGPTVTLFTKGALIRMRHFGFYLRHECLPVPLSPP